MLQVGPFESRGESCTMVQSLSPRLSRPLREYFREWVSSFDYEYESYEQEGYAQEGLVLEIRSTSTSSTSSASSASSASSTNTSCSASTSTSTSASSASSTCSSANSEDRCTSPGDSPGRVLVGGRGSPLGNASQGTEAERTASANPVPDPTPRASWRWPFGRAGSPLPPWQAERGRPTALAARPAPMRMDQAYGPPSSASPMRMRRVANALLRRLSRPPRGTTDAGRATTAPGTFSTVAAAPSPLHEGCTFLDRLAQVEARDSTGSCDVGLVPQPMRCGGTSSSLDVVGARELRADAAPTEAAIAAETATVAEAAIAGPAAERTVTGTAVTPRRKAATRRLVEPLVSEPAIRMAARMSTNPSFDEACDATSTCLFTSTYDATSCAEEKEIDFEVSTQNMDLHQPSSANFLELLAEAEARDARLLAETSV